MHKDVVAQGPSKSRRKKRFTATFFPRAMLVLREAARKTGAFPEQENSNGLRSFHRDKAKKDASTDIHTRSSGLTPTRRCSVGGPGAPSPHLVMMP